MQRMMLNVLWLSVTAVGLGQSPLAFEVTSIHRADPAERDGWIKGTPGGNGYTARNIPVKLMISLMYRVPMRQIVGAPEWTDSERYDIEAKADKPYSIDDLHVMFQSLLADRFNLKFHMENKEGPVYALLVDGPAAKMKLDTSPQTYAIPMTYGPDGMIGSRVNMRYFSWWLGQQLQEDKRPVVDKTGLGTNFYDFSLSFRPLNPTTTETSDRLSLFDALREQLGLRLQAQRGVVEYLVIDHIERAGAN